MLDLLYSVPAIKDQVENKRHVFILIKESWKDVGYASYEINYKSTNKTKIHKIYLLPETQGQGIGKQVINYIAEIALKNNNHVLTLNVNRHNPAIKFYERIGFKIVMEEDIDIGSNYFMNDYVMDKSLKPHPTLSEGEG